MLLVTTCIVTTIALQAFTVGPFYSVTCAFFAIFLLLSLTPIAAELEDPFSATANVVDMSMLQRDFNKRLLELPNQSLPL